VATQFDYIVVGAGPAGCAVACRLSEDPATSVLLVEAGGQARGPVVAMPAALPFAYQRTAIQWGYSPTASAARGRFRPQPRRTTGRAEARARRAPVTRGTAARRRPPASAR
jgi:choline dehydrogenase-like flavoprotein